METDVKQIDIRKEHQTILLMTLKGQMKVIMQEDPDCFRKMTGKDPDNTLEKMRELNVLVGYYNLIKGLWRE